MIELKPCPFCGGRALIAYDHWIYCADCNAESTFYEDLNDAIEAWNRREKNDD